MEALCTSLDCPLVMSSSMAAASPEPVRSLGHHRLRGFAAERELFTLASISAGRA
jgi:adenylate cyclase